MPALAYALAGIFGCVLQESALLNIKPDIAYRGEVGSSFQDYDQHIVIVCVPQTAVGGACWGATLGHVCDEKN